MELVDQGVSIILLLLIVEIGVRSTYKTVYDIWCGISSPFITAEERYNILNNDRHEGPGVLRC